MSTCCGWVGGGASLYAHICASLQLYGLYIGLFSVYHCTYALDVVAAAVNF